MYHLTFTKALCNRFGIYKHLIVNGWYIRIGKLVVTLWKD